MTAMMVYVVLTNDAQGVQGVFLTEGAAHRHSMRFADANPRLRGVEVAGVQADPEVAHVAQTYEAAVGRYRFAAVCGNHEDAVQAAGPGGRVLAHPLKTFVGDR